MPPRQLWPQAPQCSALKLKVSLETSQRPAAEHTESLPLVSQRVLFGVAQTSPLAPPVAITPPPASPPAPASAPEPLPPIGPAPASPPLGEPPWPPRPGASPPLPASAPPAFAPPPCAPALPPLTPAVPPVAPLPCLRSTLQATPTAKRISALFRSMSKVFHRPLGVVKHPTSGRRRCPTRGRPQRSEDGHLGGAARAAAAGGEHAGGGQGML
ncbi:MAG: hypothetical protein QM756_44145 [Polyangiaceae bacterium]